eukprot:SAG31_NODE_31588_length_366_cov_0.943820_1_plen_97_part_01
MQHARFIAARAAYRAARAYHRAIMHDRIIQASAIAGVHVLNLVYVYYASTYASRVQSAPPGTVGGPWAVPAVQLIPCCMPLAGSSATILSYGSAYTD